MRVNTANGDFYHETSSRVYKEDIHDLEKGLKNLVIYNDKNIPDGLKYDRISLYLVEVVKEQQKKITELEERIIEMQKQSVSSSIFFNILCPCSQGV